MISSEGMALRFGFHQEQRRQRLNSSFTRSIPPNLQGITALGFYLKSVNLRSTCISFWQNQKSISPKGYQYRVSTTSSNSGVHDGQSVEITTGIEFIWKQCYLVLTILPTKNQRLTEDSVHPTVTTVGIYALISHLLKKVHHLTAKACLFLTILSAYFTRHDHLQEGSDEGSETSTSHWHHLVGTSGGGGTVIVSDD